MRWWSGGRFRARARRVALLAEGAAIDDELFTPEVVEAAARRLHDEVNAAWSAGDRKRLRAAVGPELFVEWERWLSELQRRGHRQILRRRGRLRVRFVGLVNRPGDEEDRVVVHVRARMRDMVVDGAGRRVFRDSSDNGKSMRSEYWTLGKRRGRWVLLSVEGRREGAHHLEAPVIASPSEDDRLHEDAVIERGVAFAAPARAFAEAAGSVPLEFADTALATLDLAGLDGRWAPDVLEAAARRALAAWAEAVDGNRQPLIAMAGRATAEGLLYPGRDHRTRLVIRGPRLQALRILELAPTETPPRMAVEATVTACRYVQSRDTGVVVEGSDITPVTFTERWDLVLSSSQAGPWRISSRERPPIQGWFSELVGRVLPRLHASWQGRRRV